jgi:hypothetical protein
MFFRLSVGCIVILGALTYARELRADIPPPHDYVEECTLKNMRHEGEECLIRTEWAFAKEAPNYLGKMGFCRRCRTYGATYAELVYCRPKGQAPLPADWEKGLPKDPVPPNNDERLTVPECWVETSHPAPDSNAQDGRAESSKKRAGCTCRIGGDVDAGPSLFAIMTVALMILGRRRAD